MNQVILLSLNLLLAADPGDLTERHQQIARDVRQANGTARYADDCDRPTLILGLTGMSAADARLRSLAGVRGIGGLDL